MLHERLRDEDESWGLTRIEFGFRARKMEQERRREMRSQYLLRNIVVRDRNERGRFIAAPLNLPVGGKIWPVESYPGLIAFTERHERECSLQTSRKGTATIRTRVSLPFVSIQHRAALSESKEQAR